MSSSGSTSRGAYAANSAESLYKRTREMFPNATFLPAVDPVIRLASVERRKRMRFGLPAPAPPPVTTTASKTASTALALVTTTAAAATTTPASSQALTTHIPAPSRAAAADSNNDSSSNRILVKSVTERQQIQIPTPTWHAPWKLSTVLSSHLGWVRSIAVDPVENRLFATGSADRTIKIWNLAAASAGVEDALLYTLTGHISAVRGLAFSARHPYLFSCAEDKQVKCWDLETNQVVRHYHGHLSGVFCLALHPTVDVLVTAGRDAVARVWDIRTKQQVHVLTGHDHTVGAVLCKSIHPQVITGSQDCTIRMWDLVAGKCAATLTHHQKGIRALVQPSFEHSFCSGAADCLKKWQGKDGRFLQSLTGQENTIVNAMAVNDDGVLVSAGDNGSMHFWDYSTGYTFQTAHAIAQPGSLDAENSIMATAFDGTGTRLITGEADKSIKIWKPDDAASELSHPIDMTAWRKKCIAQAKERY